MTKILIKKLKFTGGLKKYFFNTSWLFAEQILRILSGLVIGAWLARHLGPNQFGVLSYAIAFAAIFGSIPKLGLDNLLVRELISKPNKQIAYLGTAFWLKLIGAFITISLIYLTLFTTNNNSPTNNYILIIALGMIFQSFEVVEFYFQSKVLARVTSICKVVQLALSSLIKIYLIIFEAELYMFVLIILFDALSLALAYLIAYRVNKNLKFYKAFDFSIAKKLLKSSWPLIFSGILVMIYMRIDQIMIKEILDDDNVGIYSAAVRISEAFYFIPMIISNSLYPAILNAKRKNKELYENRLQNLYKLMIWISIILILIMSFSSNWIINTFFGPAYYDAGPILIIHIWASIFVFMGVASGKWFIAENLQFFNMVNTGVGAVLNILLNIVLIKNYGSIGAAYSTIISYGVAVFFMNFIWKSTRDNFMMQSKSFILFRKFL